MSEGILKRLDVDLLIKLAQEMIRIPTQNPPGNERICAEYIYNTLNNWGIETEMVFEPFPQRPQVVATIYGKRKGHTLVLNGHMDVVPEGSINQWEENPYGGILKEGRIYGRGSSDMKGGLAVMMVLAKLLYDCGLPQGKLIFQFVVGEEKGEPGTKYLLTKRGIRGDYGIVLEPTSLRVATAVKGLVWFRITIMGRPVHASISEKGINPIEKTVNLIGKLLDYDRWLRPKIHPLLGSRKCTVTMINGGTKENIVPESCSIIIDRRFNPDETPNDVEKEIISIMEDLTFHDPDFKYQLERIMVYEPAEIPVNSTIAQVLRKYASLVSGIPKEPFGMVASTDVRNFINDAGIPAVNFGPGDIQQPHTFNENIEIQQMVDCTKILLLSILELL